MEGPYNFVFSIYIEEETRGWGMFSLFTPAVGGLLPPVAGREGAAAEKITLSGFFGGKSQRKTFCTFTSPGCCSKRTNPQLYDYDRND